MSEQAFSVLAMLVVAVILAVYLYITREGDR